MDTEPGPIPPAPVSPASLKAQVEPPSPVVPPGRANQAEVGLTEAVPPSPELTEVQIESQLDPTLVPKLEKEEEGSEVVLGGSPTMALNGGWDHGSKGVSPDEIPIKTEAPEPLDPDTPTLQPLALPAVDHGSDPSSIRPESCGGEMAAPTETEDEHHFGEDPSLGCGLAISSVHTAGDLEDDGPASPAESEAGLGVIPLEPALVDPPMEEAEEANPGLMVVGPGGHDDLGEEGFASWLAVTRSGESPWKALDDVFHREQFADLFFVVRKNAQEYERIGAHAIVLCQFSPILAQLAQQIQCPCVLSPCYHEPPVLDIFLPDVHVRTLQDLLELCYTGQVGNCSPGRFDDLSSLASALLVDLSQLSYHDPLKGITGFKRKMTQKKKKGLSGAKAPLPPPLPSPISKPCPASVKAAHLRRGWPTPPPSIVVNTACFICDRDYQTTSKLRLHLITCHFAKAIRARFPNTKDTCEICGKGVSNGIVHLGLVHKILQEFVTYDEQPIIYGFKPPLSNPRGRPPTIDPNVPTQPSPIKRGRKGKIKSTVSEERIQESMRDRNDEAIVIDTNDFM